MSTSFGHVFLLKANEPQSNLSTDGSYHSCETTESSGHIPCLALDAMPRAEANGDRRIWHNKMAVCVLSTSRQPLV